MVHGRSNVGSLDDTSQPGAGRSSDPCTATSPRAPASTTSWRGQAGRHRRIVADCANAVMSADRRARRSLQPQPIRTLLIDDCIDNAHRVQRRRRPLQLERHRHRRPRQHLQLAGRPQAGGVRGEDGRGRGPAGRPCATTSRATRRSACASRAARTMATSEPLLSMTSPPRSPRYVFREFMAQTPWRGGRFLASCLMFVTYGMLASRSAPRPTAASPARPSRDSAGAVQGRDAPAQPRYSAQRRASRTSSRPARSSINIRFTRASSTTRRLREQLEALIRTYFGLGGMQLQINVVDQRVLSDALAHPTATATSSSASVATPSTSTCSRATCRSST